jgi:hypothetical protein
VTPTNVILDRLAALLAADTSSLAPAALAVHVHLAINGFTPGPNLVVADFVPATFDGYAPLDADVGPQQDFVDAATGYRVVQLLEPAAGWHWVTTGLTDLPQVIYGFYVTNNADAVLYGCERFATPITLTASGQGIDIDQVRFNFIPPVLA